VAIARPFQHDTKTTWDTADAVRHHQTATQISIITIEPEVPKDTRILWRVDVL
jgi:hypothetical protein